MSGQEEAQGSSSLLSKEARGPVLKEDIPSKTFPHAVSLYYGGKGSLVKWIWKTLDKCDFSTSFKYYHPSGREKMQCFPNLFDHEAPSFFPMNHL